jgi:5-methyltetrahydropteroyltriglutamate--homocysteine methyltransferase
MTPARSTDRILTTHVGSLPRPADLRDMLVARNASEPADDPAFEALVRSSVVAVVRRQVNVGIDLVSDGEFSKFAYSTYTKERLSGIGGLSEPREQPLDVQDFPAYAARSVSNWGRLPLCEGPLAIKDRRPLERDLRNFGEAVAAAAPTGTFLTTASPGLTASFIQNAYYKTHEDYLAALVEVLREEYEAIVAAGFNIQLDCPDLASAKNNAYARLPADEFVRRQRLAVEAINAATANIAPDRMRMHVCWGNYEGPHHRDVPFASVLPIAIKARPAAILFEGANPRHEHEWTTFKTFRLPDDKVLVPGVIDSTTNFIEHPEVVAQRILRYAEVVGRERVIAGVDCGFGTSATSGTVDADIAWAKLGSLVEGARLASERLWRK